MAIGDMITVRINTPEDAAMVAGRHVISDEPSKIFGKVISASRENASLIGKLVHFKKSLANQRTTRAGMELTSIDLSEVDGSDVVFVDGSDVAFR